MRYHSRALEVLQGIEELIAAIKNGTHPGRVAVAATPNDAWATNKGLIGVAGSGSHTDPAATANPDQVPLSAISGARCPSGFFGAILQLTVVFRPPFP